MRPAFTIPALVGLALVGLGCGASGGNQQLNECGPGGACPAGFVCRTSDNSCQIDSFFIDGGVTDARPPDARPADARPADATPPDASPDAGNGPDTTITQAPAALGNSASVTFAFASTRTPATFEGSLDDAPFSACSTPFTFAVSDGAHTFRVRAVAGGETDPTPASDAFTVDTLPPDTTLTGGPSGATQSNEATFSFTSTEPNSTFRCQLDASAATPCVSGMSYTGLALGNHTFSVAATDPAGNTDPTPAVQTWNATQVTPSTTLVSSPAAVSLVSSATFTFTSDQASATFACSLDGSAFAACTSPAIYTGLADGAHLFLVMAILDTLDDPTPAAFTWTIDTVGPTAVITAGPTDGTRACPGVTFQYTTRPVETGVTFECALVPGGLPAANGQYTACPLAGQSYSGLTDAATYTFSVRAVDSGGNHGHPAISTFSIDGVGPVIAVSAPTGTTGRNIAVDFTYIAESASSFTCAIDGGQPIPGCVTGQTFSNLADGAHTAHLIGTDACGNVGSADASFQVVVSTVVAITEPVDGSTTSPAIQGIFQPGMSDHVTCGVDDPAPVTPCLLTGIVPLTAAGGAPLAEGMHTFTVLGFDAMNTQVGTATVSWHVDGVGPVLTPSATTDPNANPTPFPTDAIVTCPRARVTIGCAAGAADSTNDCPPTTAQCTVDDTTPNCDSGFLSLSDLADGPHTVTATGTDSINNPSKTPGTLTFYVDGTPPGVTIGAVGPSGFLCTSSGTIPWVVAPAEPASTTYGCAVTGGACSGGPTGAFISGPGGALPDGPHTLTAVPADACGNTPALPPSLAFTVDTQPPAAGTISLDSPNANDASVSCTGTALGFSYTFTDLDPNLSVVPGSCYLQALDATRTPAATCTLTHASFAGTMPRGAYTFHVTLTDSCGHQGSGAKTIYVESGTSGPVPAGLAPGGPQCGTPPTTFTFTPDPNESPASTHYFCEEVAGNQGSAAVNFPGTNCDAGAFILSDTSDGEHTAFVRGFDICGSPTASPPGTTFDVITALPVIAFDSPSPAPSSIAGESPTFAFHVVSGDASPQVSCTLAAADAAPVANGGQCPTAGAGLHFGPTGAVYGPLTDSAIPAGASDSPYTFGVSVTDRCTHAGSASLMFSVDATPPQVAIVAGPPAGSTSIQPGSVAVTFQATDTLALHGPASGLNTVSCALDGSPYGSCATTTSMQGPFTLNLAEAATPHTFAIHATDKVGHATTATESFYVDASAPVIANVKCLATTDASCPGSTNTAACPALNAVSGSVLCSFDVTDSTSQIPSRTDDVITCTCTMDGVNQPGCSPAALAGKGTPVSGSVEIDELAPGAHTFAVDCQDPYGNDSGTTTLPFSEQAGSGDVFLIGHDYSALDGGGQLVNLITAAASIGISGAGIPGGQKYCRAPIVRGFIEPGVDTTGRENVVDALTTGGFALTYAGDFPSGPTGPTGMGDDSATSLANAILGVDVLIIYDNKNGAHMSDLGGQWKDTLQAFVAAGGIVITLDGLMPGTSTPSNNFQILEQSGLLPGLAGVTGSTGTSAASAVGETIDLANVDDDDLIDAASADVEPYVAPASSVYYTGDTLDPAFTAVSTGENGNQDQPVMLHLHADCDYPIVVDASFGKDSNSGKCTAPFQTIGAALGAAAGQSVKVRPGTYTSGAALQVQDHTCLVGDEPSLGQGVCPGFCYLAPTVIDGQGPAGGLTVGVVAATGSTIAGFVVNGPTGATGATGTPDPTEATLLAAGASGVTVRNNSLLDDDAENNAGIYLDGAANLHVSGNDIEGNLVGIYFHGGQSSGAFDHNTVTANAYGLEIGAAATTVGDFGGGSSSSTGHNTLTCNGDDEGQGADVLFLAGGITLSAEHDTWDNVPEDIEFAPCAVGADVCYAQPDLGPCSAGTCPANQTCEINGLCYADPTSGVDTASDQPGASCAGSRRHHRGAHR